LSKLPVCKLKMNPALRNLLLLLLPFLLMVSINEIQRPLLAKKKNTGSIAMNSREADPEKCSWKCHNDTRYCKKYHVKLLKPVLGISDLFYNSCLVLLGAGMGFYQFMNIAILVIGAPFFIWFFLTRALNTGDRLHQLQNSGRKS
jgi:hypothetical protein